MSEEIVKGVSRVELMARYEAGDDIDFLFKELAEKHSKAVLEDYIKTHSAESDTVNTTYPLETKFKVGISAGHSDGYGRVYSDLEGEIEKRSSAKNEERKPYEFTKEELDKQPEIGFVLPDWLKATKAEEDVSRGTHKNKYGIGQKVFVINQNGISRCGIQEISEEEDGLILYTARDDFGCDFKLTEEEVFTTVDELLSYLHELAKSL